MKDANETQFFDKPWLSIGKITPGKHNLHNTLISWSLSETQTKHLNWICLQFQIVMISFLNKIWKPNEKIFSANLSLKNKQTLQSSVKSKAVTKPQENKHYILCFQAKQRHLLPFNTDMLITSFISHNLSSLVI